MGDSRWAPRRGGRWFAPGACSSAPRRRGEATCGGGGRSPAATCSWIGSQPSSPICGTSTSYATGSTWPPVPTSSSSFDGSPATESSRRPRCRICAGPPFASEWKRTGALSISERSSALGATSACASRTCAIVPPRRWRESPRFWGCRSRRRSERDWQRFRGPPPRSDASAGRTCRGTEPRIWRRCGSWDSRWMPTRLGLAGPGKGSSPPPSPEPRRGPRRSARAPHPVAEGSHLGVHGGGAGGPRADLARSLRQCA